MSFHRVDQPLSHLTVSGENVAVRRNSSYASLSTVVDNLIDELRSDLMLNKKNLKDLILIPSNFEQNPWLHSNFCLIPSLQVTGSENLG